MRTTVTLDSDVAAKLQALSRERKISFKEALNSSVRRGLSSEDTTAKPLKIKTQTLGLRSGFNLDKSLQLASNLEDAEVVRKLELRK